MASSTYGTYLMIKATYDASSKEWTKGNSYTKLVDIKSFPNLGGDPELIESTTLSDKQRTNVQGVESLESLVFTSNYTKENMVKLDALEGEEWEFSVWFSTKGFASENSPSLTDANEGAFDFSGTITSYPLGKGVNEVREIQSTIANSTSINFNDGTASA